MKRDLTPHQAMRILLGQSPTDDTSATRAHVASASVIFNNRGSSKATAPKRKAAASARAVNFDFPPTSEPPDHHATSPYAACAGFLILLLFPMGVFGIAGLIPGFFLLLEFLTNMPLFEGPDRGINIFLSVWLLPCLVPFVFCAILFIATAILMTAFA